MRLRIFGRQVLVLDLAALIRAKRAAGLLLLANAHLESSDRPGVVVEFQLHRASHVGAGHLREHDRSFEVFNFSDTDTELRMFAHSAESHMTLEYVPTVR